MPFCHQEPRPTEIDPRPPAPVCWRDRCKRFAPGSAGGAAAADTRDERDSEPSTELVPIGESKEDVKKAATGQEEKKDDVPPAFLLPKEVMVEVIITYMTPPKEETHQIVVNSVTMYESVAKNTWILTRDFETCCSFVYSKNARELNPNQSLYSVIRSQEDKITIHISKSIKAEVFISNVQLAEQIIHRYPNIVLRHFR